MGGVVKRNLVIALKSLFMAACALTIFGVVTAELGRIQDLLFLWLELSNESIRSAATASFSDQLGVRESGAKHICGVDRASLCGRSTATAGCRRPSRHQKILRLPGPAPVFEFAGSPDKAGFPDGMGSTL